MKHANTDAPMSARVALVWIACVAWVLPAAAQVIQSPQHEALTMIEHPTPEELERGFEGWAKQYPDTFTFESRGTTVEGRPILMGRITDRGVADEDKQVAVFTSCHGPKEIGAMTGLLRLMKWLLSDDAEAAEIRRRQIVLVVPYTDPDHVALGELKQTRYIYSGTVGGKRLWTVDGVTDPQKHPEAAALQGIFDEYRPELYIDYHGHNHAERTMWDTTGISWGAPISRSFLHDIPRIINDATEAQGFLVNRGEEDDGKLLTTSPIPGYPDYLFYLRHPRGNVTLYPYARYHTLAFIMEVGSEERLIASTKAALRIGHETGRYERYESYPVNQVGAWTFVSLSAYGETAAERRRSRVELWQKLPQIFYGQASPPPARGSMMGYVSTTEKGLKLRGGCFSNAFENLRGLPHFDIEGLVEAASGFPYKAFSVPRPHYKPDEGAIDAGPIEHGLVIRLMVPYRDARIEEVRLDGHLVSESDAGGYHLKRGPGLILEFAIPPDKVKDLHIVSCKYDTDTVRRAGFTSEDW